MINRDKIFDFIGKISPVQFDFPLSKLTYFGIGGNATAVVRPQNVEQLALIVSALERTGSPYFILGNGTNILASDSGFDGVIVSIGNGLNRIEQIAGSEWYFGAGASLTLAIKTAATSGFGGLEPLAGIPGSVGGAIKMNAGAYGTSFFDRTVSVDALISGEIVTYSAELLTPKYRDSALPPDAVFTGATMTLVESDTDTIAAQIADYDSRRRQTQPLNEKCAGCIFKNPPDNHAGWLIEQCGLKGTRNGDAQISEIHANFIVNKANATAAQVVTLIETARATVLARFGIALELEVVKLGAFQ
jgi:UDP-N-acetylmuramate dehydrogenase